MSVVLLHIFKPLEMQRQNCGQLLHSHSLVGLLNVIRLHPLSWCTMHYLVGAASITFKFVIRAQGLGGGEVSETVCNTRVLRNKGMSDRMNEVTQLIPGQHRC